jgi:hypothetical protein
MNTKFITIFHYIILLSYLVTASHSYADLEETQIGGLYERFNPDYRYLSPVYGFLMLKSHLLSNIRFYGNFGPKNEEFLCHKQITNPALNLPSTADKDCPQDSTTALLQHFFPSPGDELTISNAKSDFFGQLSIESIGKLLKAYTEKTVNEALLSELGKKNKSAIGSSWKDVIGAEKSGPGPAFDKLIKQYTILFSNAPAESEYYPYYFIESALLALATKKANTVDDLRPLLAQLQEYQEEMPESKRIFQNIFILISSHKISKIISYLNKILRI